MFFLMSLQNDERTKAKLDFSSIMGCCWSCEDRSGFDQDAWNSRPDVVLQETIPRPAPLIEMIPSPHFGTPEKEDIAEEPIGGSDEKFNNDIGSDEKESDKKGEATAKSMDGRNEIKDNEKAFEKVSDGNTDQDSNANSFDPNHDINKVKDDKTFDDKSSFEQSVAKAATNNEIEANSRRSEEDKNEENGTVTIADDKSHEDVEGKIHKPIVIKRLWQ